MADHRPVDKLCHLAGCADGKGDLVYCDKPFEKAVLKIEIE